ncbi:hypothetical protein Pla175_03940 [Pirellulimonas nuda]|uniref:DUF4239 domain-containing protein n=1 Tax=Pirellulimonas nuda TaxID=2528009 RepID=A0A518D6G9_9BACT|nr:DUF4239 domain-containing protein [Pirellulimonas nuda]QDU87039.1 hypothetical protein Pla175_03940 [Pirellulimonas nuda]
MASWQAIAALSAVMFLCNEIGFRLGRRLHANEPELSRSASGAIKASIFALVAFLVAVSFSTTAARHDTRRRVVLDEANALGTCYLRAGLLQEPQRSAIRATLVKFVDARLAYFDDGLNIERSKQARDTMGGLLNDLWRQVEAAAAADATQTRTSQIVPAANDVIDLASTRDFAAASHLQPAVLWLLVTCVLVFSLLIGHSSGQSTIRHLGLWCALNLLFGMVLFVVLDFDRPRRGLIQVNHTPLVELRASMGPASSAPAGSGG